MGTHPIFESDFDCLTEMPVNPGQPIEQLLIDVNEFTPVLPDTVSHLLLTRAGLDTEHDPRIELLLLLKSSYPTFCWTLDRFHSIVPIKKCAVLAANQRTNQRTF